MRSMVALLLVLLVAEAVPVLGIPGLSAPPPVWPVAYEISYNFRMPYLDSIQAAGLNIPVHIWYDGTLPKTRMDVYNGLDSTYALPDFTYNLFPRIDKRACWRISSASGPTIQGMLQNEGGSQPPLPDISSWQYAGATKLHGVPAFIWTYSENHYEKTNVYTFYTSQADEKPLKLHMAGVNLFSGSHFDEYIVDFNLFNKLYPGAATVFQPPRLCDNPSGPPEDMAQLGTAMQAQALALLPSHLVASPSARVRAATAATTLHARSKAQQVQQVQHLHAEVQRGDVGRSADELVEARGVAAAAARGAQAHLQANQQLVEGWNAQHAPAAGFKLKLNRFAAWPHEHFVATRMGHAPPRREAVGLLRSRIGSAYLGTFRRRLSNEQLPARVDYRGTGADGHVKDQASCGSCWAFGTTGTMSGTWFLATGESLSLSEQHIVDCSWDYDVNGCWGGFGESAMDMVKAAGGAVMEDEYPYIGQNGYCKNNATTKAAYFSGYQDIPEGDEQALMEALATHGPLYVALDASDAKFKFYSEGVYHRDDCATDRDHLNHAVTLVGYGTTDSGVDYWLIRNSWSKLWGQDGYMKITRKGNDCGITTGAMLAVPDAEAVARTRAGLTRSSVQV